MKMKVPYSYLNLQFANPEPVIKDIRKLAKSGDFTLGSKVAEFEASVAKFQGTKYAIGLSSGTAALLYIMRVLGIGPGDEVITAPNSFYATAAAIDLVGAKIVFADVNAEYNLDPQKVEKAITKKTKAILFVHWTGNPAGVEEVLEIAKKHKLYLIEDAAQAIDASVSGKRVGSFGIANEFSLHPIKNFNVWGDGGFVTTNEAWIVDKMKLMRNHGIKNRDEVEFWSYNDRLHSLQAVVALRLLPKVKSISEARIKIAAKYDKLLSDIPQIIIPLRRKNVRQVYHTYILQTKTERNELVKYLIDHGVDAKVHYPIPLHLQKPARQAGYKKGDFPVTEYQAEHIFSLPNNQYLTADQIKYVAETIHKFYLGKV